MCILLTAQTFRHVLFCGQHLFNSLLLSPLLTQQGRLLEHELLSIANTSLASRNTPAGDSAATTGGGVQQQGYSAPLRKGLLLECTQV